MFAENVMSSEVLVLKLDTDVRVKDAAVLLEESGLHELPVVDQNGKPVGLVSARSILHLALPKYATDNLLSLMKSGPDIASIYENLDEVFESSIHTVIDREVNVVNLNAPTIAVAAMLVNLKGDSRNILVVNDVGKLVGIITARDLICRQLK